MDKERRVGFRVTQKQQEFLQRQSKEEKRTITAMINIALTKQYPEYKKIIEEENISEDRRNQ